MRAALACAALSVLAATWGWGASPAAERAPEPVLRSQDLAAVRRLLERLASAMVAGDANALGALLSPALPQSERGRIVARARGEFARVTYPRFEFDLRGEVPAEWLAPDGMKIVVPAEYEYESRAQGGARMASVGETAYEFRLSRVSGEWFIAGSDLFEQFAALRLEQVLGWAFLAGFAGLLAVAFWFWMALDAYFRARRPRDGLLVLASTPVGAALYFFAVYLRRKFIRRDE